MVKELASYGQVMEPEQIAAETLTGVERGVFYISHGFDGFMLATLTSGASPVSSLFELLTQVTHCFVVASFHSVPHAGPLLMGVFRIISRATGLGLSINIHVMITTVNENINAGCLQYSS